MGRNARALSQSNVWGMDILSKTKERFSNYELMRIISIYFVILGHTLSWGGIDANSTPAVNTLIKFIYAIIIVHVNSFILVSGYFQSESKFKLIKVIKLLFYMWLYTLIFTLIGYKFGWIEYTMTGFIQTILPIKFSSYWFIKVYIVLYCLSPLSK